MISTVGISNYRPIVSQIMLMFLVAASGADTIRAIGVVGGDT